MGIKKTLQKAEDTLQEYNSSVPKSLFRLSPKPYGKDVKKVKSVKARDGGTFEVYERPAKAGQDRYQMYHAFGTGRGLDLGTHPSADGALKFARNNGIIESNLKLAEARYDSYGYNVKDRWDGEKPRATGRDYFGNKMSAEPEAAIFKTKSEAEKYAKKMGRKVAGKPFKNVGSRGEEWIVMVKEDLYEQIMEASSDKVLNQLIANLKKEMSKIDKIDPSSNAYKKMIKFLDATAKVNPQAMKTLADADVKFLSKLAKNRLKEAYSPKNKVSEALVRAEEIVEAIGDTHDFKDIKSKIKTLTKRGFKVDITDKHGWQFAQAEKVNPSPTDITAVNVFVKSLKAKPVKAAKVDAGVTRYEVPYTTENGLDTAFLVDVVRNSDGNRPDRKLSKDAIGVYLMK